MAASSRNIIMGRRDYQVSKVIDISEAKRYKNFEKESIDILELRYFAEIFRKIQEFANSYDKILPEKKSKEYIVELERENEELKNKLENSIPVHIIVYMAICSLIIGISLTLLVLRFVWSVYIIEPYYIICALLISLTLFMTAIVAIKDWKDYMVDGEKR